MLVVPWRFPYGPGVGPQNIQDSFYCQPGQLEHARRRYCAAAGAVLNTDIDELVVTSSGTSIFELAEENGYAATVFPGIWVEKTWPVRRPLIRHADCVFGQRRQQFWRWIGQPKRLLRTKWIAVPDRCDDDMEWGVHNVYAASRKASATAATWRGQPDNIHYRHFRQLTTRSLQTRKEVKIYSPFRHVHDRELSAAFAKAFPQRDRGWRAFRWVRRFLGRKSRG